MQLIRGLHNLNESHCGGALTIGNFDGVHLGHLEILNNLAHTAQQRRLSSCVMSFEPLPMEYFNRKVAPPRLHRLQEKWTALQQTQVDYFLCAKFNRQLAELSAYDFIKHILVEKLSVNYLLVGDDFRFGNKRCGDFETLLAAGKKYGFDVHNSTSYCFEGKRISSSRIRDALMQDQFTVAAQMLGRPYKICGHVVHGEKRGRTIGFPTANIKLHRHAAAVKGVYAVHLTGDNGLSVNGVANVGKRPTVDGQNLQLEVHLFNFNQTLYGKKVCVEFKQRIRDEKRFNSFDDLKQQITKDAEQAQAFFATETDH